MSIKCCSKSEFTRHPDPKVADIGSSDGVEYTIGLCKACKANLIHLWIAGGAAQQEDTISGEFLSALKRADTNTRKRLLSDWFESRS